MPPHPLTNFEIQKYHQNEPRFNGVYSRDNLPKIKDGAYIINLDEYSDIGTHWIALYVQNNNNNNNNNVIYFDSFVVEHIPKKIRVFINNNNNNKNDNDNNSNIINIITNIFRIQAYNSNNVWLFLYWFY